jgi:lysine-N-methylase
VRIELPTIQNWNCHSCGGCCTQHEVVITDEEKRRIEEQAWTPADGVPADRPVIKTKGPPWARYHVLNWQDDGACVFLDERGLCRMHAKFGEPSKPLACRVYPYAFHPAGKKVVVSVRYSCPSAVENKGRPIGKQRTDVEALAREVVPAGIEAIEPPPISRGSTVGWPDFLRFVSHLEEELANGRVPVVIRVIRALTWLDDVERASFAALEGKRLDEFVELLRQAAAVEVPSDLAAIVEPSRAAKLVFRQHVANYARRDTQGANTGGLRNRWRLLRAAMKFASGRGNVPPLQSVFAEVPFAKLEEPFGPLPPEAEEMLERYLRVKVSGLQFCGRAFFGASLVEGFRFLALVIPSILWLARWLAAGEGRGHLLPSDVARAMAIADHFHAYAPASGGWTARRRLRLLAGQGEVRKLCAWYAR